MNLMKGDAFQAFMSILGTGLEEEEVDGGAKRRGKAGRKTARSSKSHGRLYAVQKGDDRRERDDARSQGDAEDR
jgi:hypothetical protein